MSFFWRLTCLRLTPYKSSKSWEENNNTQPWNYVWSHQPASQPASSIIYTYNAYSHTHIYIYTFIHIHILAPLSLDSECCRLYRFRIPCWYAEQTHNNWNANCNDDVYGCEWQKCGGGMTTRKTTLMYSDHEEPFWIMTLMTPMTMMTLMAMMTLMTMRMSMAMVMRWWWWWWWGWWWCWFWWFDDLMTWWFEMTWWFDGSMDWQWFIDEYEHDWFCWWWWWRRWRRRWW